MKIKRPPFIAIVLVVVALLAGAYYLYNANNPVTSDLTASGTVEATEILIAPEQPGKVTEVLVNEGDLVNAGDVLFRLDDALYQSQRQVALAGLSMAQAASLTADAAVSAAQAQYDLVLTAALAEQKANRTVDWIVSPPAEFTQPIWYFDAAEQVAAAQAEVDAAQSALDTAQSKLITLTEKAASGDFISAEKRLLNARAAFLVSQDMFNRIGNVDQSLRDSVQQTYDDALSELTNAQKDYENTVTTNGAADVLNARADWSVAQERYDTALDRLRSLQTGNLSPQVIAAQRGLEQAQAAAAQAGSAIQQAEANLALLETQINKLTVTAPSNGMILTRAVQPGEVVMPGSGLLTMAQLSDLSITVYVPEDRYGEISIGQTAVVTVDSFPDETFAATVVYISGKAEFTPRNVQTVEGRKTTVFAIKLRLEDAGGKLKPGMPADILFK